MLGSLPFALYLEKASNFLLSTSVCLWRRPSNSSPKYSPCTPQNLWMLSYMAKGTLQMWWNSGFEAGRLSRITLVGLEGCHRCPYKRTQGMWWQDLGLERFTMSHVVPAASKAGRGKEQTHPRALRGTSHADNFIYPEKLISKFWPSELYKNKFMLL